MQGKVFQGDVWAAGVIIFENDDFAGRVLAFQRTKDGQLGIPFGKVDPGESAADAAVRETFEETGFTVKLLSDIPYVGLSTNTAGKKVAAFLATIVSGGQPLCPQEGTPVWVTQTELFNSAYGDFNKSALNFLKQSV